MNQSYCEEILHVCSDSLVVFANENSGLCTILRGTVAIKIPCAVMGHTESPNGFEMNLARAIH